MGNIITNNPWIIDTASATAVVDSVTATQIATDLIRISKIRWEDGNVAGGEAIVQDKNGVEFWKATIENITDAPRETEFQGQSGNINGMIVPTLAAGKLYIYYA